MLEELTVPDFLKELQPTGFNYFAFPFGLLDDKQLSLIKERFKGALSVWQGSDDNPYKLNRLEVHSSFSFLNNSVFFRDPLKNGLISVIVPTYNVEKYIRDFFKSILSQTYSNLEILIILDAPTDNTEEIVNYYALQDKRIKILKNDKNLGVAKTLCKGYLAATGDFCATMSPDDTIDMFYFENLIKKYKETKSDIICAKLLATQKNWVYSDFDLTVYPFAGKISTLFYFYPALVKRKLIVEHDIWNNQMEERHWEDILIRCKYAYYANHVSVSSKAIRYYTIRNTSLSHQPEKVQLEYKEKAEKRSLQFLRSCGIDDIKIKIIKGFQIEGGWDIKDWFVPKIFYKKKRKKFLKKIVDKLIHK